MRKIDKNKQIRYAHQYNNHGEREIVRVCVCTHDAITLRRRTYTYLLSRLEFDISIPLAPVRVSIQHETRGGKPGHVPFIQHLSYLGA